MGQAGKSTRVLSTANSEYRLCIEPSQQPGRENRVKPGRSFSLSQSISTLQSFLPRGRGVALEGLLRSRPGPRQSAREERREDHPRVACRRPPPRRRRHRHRHRLRIRPRPRRRRRHGAARSVPRDHRDPTSPSATRASRAGRRTSCSSTSRKRLGTRSSARSNWRTERPRG